MNLPPMDLGQLGKIGSVCCGTSIVLRHFFVRLNVAFNDPRSSLSDGSLVAFCSRAVVHAVFVEVDHGDAQSPQSAWAHLRSQQLSVATVCIRSRSCSALSSG